MHRSHQLCPSQTVNGNTGFYCPAANEAVKKVIDSSDTGPSEEEAACSSQHRVYEHFTLKEKACIGKRAVQHSVTATIRFDPLSARKAACDHGESIRGRISEE